MKGGIDQVVNKLKVMIQNFDNIEVRSEVGVSSVVEDIVNDIEIGIFIVVRVKDVDLVFKLGLVDQDDMRIGVKVKVFKIKKIFIFEDDEFELEEIDFDEEEMEELNMDK